MDHELLEHIPAGIVGVFSLMMVAVITWVGRLVSQVLRQSQAINRAVNQKPATVGGKPSMTIAQEVSLIREVLGELSGEVKRSAEFRNSFLHSPLNTGEKVIRFVEADSRVKNMLLERQDSVDLAIQEHNRYLLRIEKKLESRPCLINDDGKCEARPK